ncbi:DUF982 domain-containing protein [Mesorhizobium sp. M7A.F.Ca.US.006.04.2.1]|nr:DUF982 domain-containing protein [Mesorhizobium sp. M7A.F.Ca.US.005.03.1.1]RUY11493.1 DUF982 domain-containing protein [Mesorhizobium sp. M7A.F.Ca.US.005.03.2.1]RUY35443.1 DUF982 domain-containing protein [Mesorhizobium sp. M7A.F.Ca.US.001.04.1.1]RUY94876.1 DUF982 domain-containing protein [Mesorhizobium sp. M7A.F.Ca.CA.001.12.2.1]RUZ14121.1 DUF982 domain-containing protein [Mesorhizobium sp. M7A.F.Ca.US.007.01.2.1]RUZ42466.1 DUF982 domain-containing protein [Mesorhizobium sp. M7A.F.Ca.US.0
MLRWNECRRAPFAERWWDRGDAMHDAFFRVPVTIELPNGELRRLSSASEAAILLMEKWPDEHGSIYRDALQACTGSLTSDDEVENARQAFLAAAEEAGLTVQGVHYNEDTPSPRSIEQPKSSYIADEKRRDRGHREEQEDFLIRFLARETGITEAQARELIDMVGTDRGSLLREARILKARR